MTGTIGHATDRWAEGTPRIQRVTGVFTPWEWALTALLCAVVATLALGNREFASQFPFMVQQFAATGVVALGLAPVILSGGIDLSVGVTASLSGVVMGSLWQSGLNIWLACLIAMVVAAAIGLTNGLIIVRAHIQPIIATLAMMFILMSVATAIAGPNPPYGFPSAFTFLGLGRIGPVPVQLIVLGIVAAVVVLWTTKSVFGRHLVMVGLNDGAARYSGVHVDRLIVAVYVWCSTVGGLAGLLLAAYYSSVRRDLGDSLLLPALTMVVVGGIDIFGGRGRIMGVVIAIFVLGLLSQGLLARGYSQLTTGMVIATVLLVAIGIKSNLSGASLVRRIQRWLSPSTVSNP